MNTQLHVEGRHLDSFAQFKPKNIESTFSICEDSVTLRLDDKENLSWWLEIDLPKDVLVQLLKEIELNFLMIIRLQLNQEETILILKTPTLHILVLLVIDVL